MHLIIVDKEFAWYFTPIIAHLLAYTLWQLLMPWFEMFRPGMGLGPLCHFLRGQPALIGSHPAQHLMCQFITVFIGFFHLVALFSHAVKE